MVNVAFPVDEDDKVARLRLKIVTERMKSNPGYGDHDAGEHAYSGTGDIEGTDVDYLNIEDELEKGSMMIPTLYAKNQPLIAERMEYHMKEVGFHLRYMAEGGANIIFKIELSGTDRIPLLPPLTRTKMLALQGMLLRVRKYVSVAALNTRQIMDGYERRIKPMFHPKYLLRQKLIRLPKGITALLMQMVQRAELDGIRSPKRAKGVLVPQSNHVSTLAELWPEDYAPLIPMRAEEVLAPQSDHVRVPAFEPREDYGILIQDLSPRVASEHLLEFKPKWLMLSRSAPADAKRCRTCALREMRRADGTPPGRGDSNFCPLDLLSGKARILRSALRKLWTVDELAASDDDDGDWEDVLLGEVHRNRFSSLEREFRRKVQPLLGRLKSLQGIHRHAGLHDFALATDDEVSLAMALRDCSVFLRVEAIPKKIEILDVKLADLDLKFPEPGKRHKWMKMEQRMIEEGWYEGKMAPGVVKGEVVCRVSRTCT